MTTETSIKRLEMPNHNGPYAPKCVLQTFDHYIPDAMTYNGYSDSRQVLVYFKHGEEIARSENGVRTYTHRFKELCHELVDKMFKGMLGGREQEPVPVLWGVKSSNGQISPYAHGSKKDAEITAAASHLGTVAAPLYTTPPQRPWVGLTDEETDNLWLQHDLIRAHDRKRQAFARALEVKLKEKNT